MPTTPRSHPTSRRRGSSGGWSRSAGRWAAALACLLPAITAAQTWDGGGTNSLLSEAANWNPDVVPSTTAHVTFAGTTRLTPSSSFNFSYASLTFNNTAGAFVFGGTGTLSLGISGLTHNDDSLQTFNNPVRFSGATGAITANATTGTSGGLRFNGTFTLPTTSLTLNHTAPITLSGPLSGSGTLIKNGAGTLNLHATATPYTADFTLNAGPTVLVHTGTTQTFGATSAVTLAAGATLRFDADATFSGGAQLTSVGGSALTVAPGRSVLFETGSDAVFTTPNNTNGSTFRFHGAGTTLTAQNSFELQGGALTLEAGATASFATYLDVTSSTLTVRGAGTSLTSSPSIAAFWGFTSSPTVIDFSDSAQAQIGHLRIGNSGVTASTTTVTVATGADVASAGLQIATSSVDGVSGSLTVNGAGSTWTQSGASTLTIGSALGGTGLLEVENQGTFTSGTGLTTINPRGRLDVTSGGMFTALGDVDLTGALNLTAGGRTFFAGTARFSPAGATVITVDGAGSQLLVGNTSQWGIGGATTATFSRDASIALATTTIGNSGTTRLTVRAGADVSSGALTLGDTQAGTAALTLTDADSSWTVSSPAAVIIGQASGGGATLTIGSGALFSTGTGGLDVRDTGQVLLEGGTLNITGSHASTGAFTFASGALHLLGTGHDLTLAGGDFLGAHLMLGTDRQLTVGGTTILSPLSSLTLDGGTLRTGSLVNNSATLDFRRGTLGITGAGGLTLGSGGPFASLLTLAPGARLDVVATTTVASGATLTVDGGILTSQNLNNHGLIDQRAGQLTIAGAITNTGRLFVTGTVTADGAITNLGRLTLRDGLGTLTGAGTTLANSGVVTGDGTLALAVANLAGAQLRALEGETLLITGGLNPNAGTISLQGGTVEVTSAVTNSATGFVSGRGTLRSTGTINHGVFALSGGTTDLFGDFNNTTGARVVTSGAGATTTFHDDVTHNGLEIHTGAGASTVFFGAQSGAGSFTGTGTVYYVGDLRPGNSPAAVSYEGDLALGSLATLTLELAGLAPGTGFDQLFIGGTLHASGTLEILLLDGFSPTSGATFDLIEAGATTGAFRTVLLPTLAPGLTWDLTALYTAGQLSVFAAAIPEPATTAALLAALTLLAAALHRHWRRR